MGISRTPTLLSLDEYADAMQIPGWLFNQILHPSHPSGGGCDACWFQRGYMSNPNRIVGRDDLASTIRTATRRFARYCRFWPAPTWITDEEITWPVRADRDPQDNYPIFHTIWGYLISGGVEAWDEELTDVAIDYSDRDGDGVLDWATIEIADYLLDATLCEIEVVPQGRDPRDREWRIRPLTRETDGGVHVLEGPRWLFVDPDVWDTVECHNLDEDAYFLEYVDIWRHYNDTSDQATYHWVPGSLCDDVCTSTDQTACMSVTRSRNGKFFAEYADYDEDDGWTRSTVCHDHDPAYVTVNYYAGLRWPGCNTIDEMIKQALVSLVNVYLPQNPCGLDATIQRYEKDKQELEILTMDIAMAQAAFGTTAAGAVFAMGVAKSLEPLGRGG